jgi:1-deoxy-D-xylulose-5-phosphate synthase
LRRLAPAQFPQLAQEIRDEIIETVCKTGGHLGSNLGVVEITLALHRVFDFRRDRLVFDVSHQVYPHKLLTGRRARFHTIRQTGGLTGFCSREESDFDLFTAGHAGTAISAALGMACADAADSSLTDRNTVALVGDAGLGCGVAFEGLNFSSVAGRRLIIVLNDNEWSISKSVGALSQYLSRIRTNPLVSRAERKIADALHHLPVVGDRLDQALEILRHLAVPGHIFEDLGVRYVGPLNGHDVALLMDTFERVKKLDGVTLVHLLTHKGHGYGPASSDPQRAHGVAPKSAPKKLEPEVKSPAAGCEVPSALDKAAPKKRSFTEWFANALIALAERDPKIVAITAAMPEGTGLNKFAERFPSRFFDTGITEQHAVAFAGGLARAGARPVAAIYSTFLQRGYDQVFQEVLLQGNPVVFAMDRGGLVGQDGPTHNGLFDIAYLRAFPGVVLMSPRDGVELTQMLTFAARLPGPSAIRYPRGGAAEDSSPRQAIELGRAEVLTPGQDATIFAYGPLCEQALEARARLAALGVDVEVVNARFAKPLDLALLRDRLAKREWIFTVEEHAAMGGIGSAVLEAAADLAVKGEDVRARVVVFGVPDRWIEHASSREEQLAQCGLDAASIASRIANALRAHRGEAAVL